MKSLLFLFLLAVPALSTSVVRSGKPLATALAAYSSTKNDAKRVWWDRFGTASKDFICYEPSLPSNDWKVLGHRGQQNHDDLTYPILAFRPLEDGALASAQGFEFIWDDRFGTNWRDASLWRPSCPSGYVALGDLFYPMNYIDEPHQDLFEKFRCVRSDLTERCIIGDKVWDDGGSTSWYDVSVWEPLPSELSIGGFLYGHNVHGNPPKINIPIDDTALASAQGFEFIWDDRYGTNLRDASLWRPSCPSGYVALGDVFYARNLIEVPGQDLFHKFRCVRSDLTERCNVGDKVWDDGGSTSWFDVSVWEPLPSERSIGGFLYGHNKHAHPPQITMYCLLKTSYGILYGI